MPKLSKDGAAEHTDHSPVEKCSAAVDGYAIGFVRFAVHIDSIPLPKHMQQMQEA